MTTTPPAQPVLSMTENEKVAVEMSLRFMALHLKRSEITGFYCMPITAGFACNAEQARAIESALEKIAQY